MNNVELVKFIEEMREKFKDELDSFLDDFLGSIEGYNELSDESKCICKIFLCVKTLYALDNFGRNSNEKKKV